jgi:cell wall-associated NlpC family hydrolase
MHHFQKTPRHVRSLLVVSLLSLAICLPLLSQPFGWSSAWKTTVAGSEEATNSYIDSVDYFLNHEPTYGLDFEDDIYSRSYNGSNIKPEDIDPTDVEGEFTDETENFTDLPYFYILTPEYGTIDLSPAVEPVYTPADYTLYINANTLNLRAEPSTESAVIKKLEFGDKVTCIGENNEWMLVQCGDATGYVKTEYTSKTMVFESVKQTVYVSASKLNLRKEPSTESDDNIITVLTPMQKLTRTGIGDGWSRVRTSSGKTGYVVSKYLTTQGPVSKGTGTPSGIEGPTYPGDAGQIVKLAYDALGVRYVHCGSSMSGFDCSGLVSWLYRQIGITLPRSTSGYYSVGKEVSLSDVQPGDVICMDTRTRDGKTSITHVGVYVGNGLMIHASSTKGRVVLADLSNYLKYCKLICIRRVLG